MTELLELVAFVSMSDEKWKCPFSHEPAVHDKVNKLPPPAKVNNASTLSDNLDDKSRHLEDIDITFQAGGQTHSSLKARYTAHHVLPGNEAWADGKNQLRKWVEKKAANHIKGDIGYDVNHHTNGVDLPGNKGVAGWRGKDETYQSAYAFASMAANNDRQFHDRHPAYSDFVINVLNKIAEKLAALEPNLGCGDVDCAGANAKPYDPPYKLLARLKAVASRFEGKLVGTEKNWQKPVMTSRFALMYQNKNLTQDQAREELNVDKFTY